MPRAMGKINKPIASLSPWCFYMRFIFIDSHFVTSGKINEDKPRASTLLAFSSPISHSKWVSNSKVKFNKCNASLFNSHSLAPIDRMEN